MLRQGFLPAAVCTTALTLASLGATTEEAPARAMLVVCAPGYPGNTADAQPTMDAFAAATAAASGLAPGRLGAVYHETAAAGLRRLQDPDAALAVVSLALQVQYGAELGLRPVLQAEPAGGGDEVWSLVARKGAVRRPQDLAAWEITGRPGYAPAFVRDALLGDWGRLPETARITFTDRPVSALRRADAGEKVAVLLDREQADALKGLPFGGNLEVVTRTHPLPAVLVCRVGNRLGEEEARAILDGLLALHRGPAGNDVLATMRLKRFQPLDRPALREILGDLPEAGHGR